MKLFFKKLTLVSLIATLFFQLNAYAVVGLFSWNPAMMGLGLVGSTTGYLIGNSGGYLAEKGNESDNKLFKAVSKLGWVLVGVGGAIGLVGWIAMDNEGGALEFREIDENIKNKLMLSEEEVQIYNNELEIVNLISYQVAHDLLFEKEQSIEIASKAWSKYRDYLSPETYIVMGKLSAYVYVK